MTNSSYINGACSVPSLGKIQFLFETQVSFCISEVFVIPTLPGRYEASARLVIYFP
jgi:hypothetical protein